MGLLFLLAIVVGFSIAIGFAAENRGRSWFGWFIFSVLLSPLVAGFFLIIFPNLEAERRRQQERIEDRAFAAKMLERN